MFANGQEDHEHCGGDGADAVAQCVQRPEAGPRHRIAREVKDRLTPSEVSALEAAQGRIDMAQCHALGPGHESVQTAVREHAASFIAHTEAGTGAELPRFIKDEFDAFLDCGVLAHGFLRLRCDDCGHDKLLAFSCKRLGKDRKDRKFNHVPQSISAPSAYCQP